CAYGNGFYNVYYEGGLVCSGGEFGASETCSDIACQGGGPCTDPDAIITLEILTDNYGSETTWQLVEQGVGVVASGGPYPNNTLLTVDVDVCSTSCYDFTIFDSYGDGICCAYGNGFYNVYYEGGLVCSGGEFGASETCSDIACEPPGPSGFLDVKPGSCPNSFNRNSNGVLPVALVGTDAFDVTQADVSTLLLSRADGVGGAVAPNEGPPGPHSVLEDVTTPFAGETCECDEPPADGIMDLSMKFWSSELVEALELHNLSPGDFIELELSGALLDGTEFAASDCIRLVPPGDMDGDGAVGVPDLLGMLAGWGSCPAPPLDCLADINDDGKVDVPDLLALLANWGSCF
ncbi:MAG: hypothetical protein ACYS1E_04455, partial [Planctomycetota bacterium]